MSMEEKQSYLREAILEKGINPQIFFEYWSTLDIELEDVTIDTLRDVVTGFLQNHPVQQQDINAEEEDQEFTDFQEAPQHKQQKQVKQEYANFNWDFLSKPHTHHEQKPVEKKIVEVVQSKVLVQVPKVQSISKKKEQVKPEIVIKPRKTTNLIEQLDESPVNKYAHERLPIENINPKDEKTLTVKQVLQSSKLNKIKCLKLQENVLSHHMNVEIFITNIEEIEEKSTNILNKFIKNSYLQFTIKTVARNKNRSIGISWEVKRKSQDFDWLRSMLIRFYPGVVVPPLPIFPKSKQKIFGYQKKLQHFLLDCYRCPQLRNSKYYEVFLSYSNQTDFDAFIKNSETISKPKTLNHVLNMTGAVQTLYSKDIEQYGIGLQNYLNKTSQHLKQVKQILIEINEAYDKISDEYKNLASVFFQMSDESHSFSDQVCYQRLANTYKQIAILSGQHSNFCESQKDFIDAFMQSHFAYEKDRLDNMQGLITKRSLFAAELAKRPKQQESKGGMFGKIASFFGQKSESVDVPSSNYENLNNQVGFYNNQLLRQSVRCVEVMIESHINHFSGYGHSRIDNVDKMQKIWSNILVELSKLNAIKKD